jgi:hypothetical protein
MLANLQPADLTELFLPSRHCLNLAGYHQFLIAESSAVLMRPCPHICPDGDKPVFFLKGQDGQYY